MLEIKCDKCGKVCTNNYTSFDRSKESMLGRERYLSKEKKIDLCPDCAKEFDKWLKLKPDMEAKPTA